MLLLLSLESGSESYRAAVWWTLEVMAHSLLMARSSRPAQLPPVGPSAPDRIKCHSACRGPGLALSTWPGPRHSHTCGQAGLLSG